jgi:beta-D-xylosidase 4
LFKSTNIVPGEDPYLTSRYVSAFVNGLQGEGPRLRVAAACKHFVANSLENWGEYTRHDFDAHVSQEDLFDYYFPPFRECVKQAMGVMCSYNALNGKPTCTNQWLLQDILRNEWGFQGYVVSDCGALEDIVTGHHSAVDPIQASAMALNASVDLNCGDGGYYPEGLLQAFKEKWVEESAVRNGFARLARVQFRLGLFDPKDYYPDDDIGIVGSHSDLAMSAAQQSIVLLKNEGNLLPLRPKQTMAMIGPHIYANGALLGNYHGDRCSCAVDADAYDCIQTPLEAIEELNLLPVLAVKGCNIASDDLDEIILATEAAREAAVVLLVVGLDQSQEREGVDRYETTLPGLQSKLIESVLQVASEKTILVIFHGGAVSLGDYVRTKTPAILSLPYGGQAASKALASVMFGDYNPTGKLAATMYPPSYVQKIPLTEMGLRGGGGYDGRTHMYYDGPTEFPFGHGLSYSEWRLEWSGHQLNRASGRSDGAWTVQVNITVYNTGPLAGSQNVLLFWQPSNRTLTREKLLAFQGTGHLYPGQHEALQFELQDIDFALWNTTRRRMAVSTDDCVLVAKASSTEVKMTLHHSHISASLPDVATNE